jgi:hypothetical protein
MTLPTLSLAMALTLVGSSAAARTAETRGEELRAMRAEKAQRLERERQGSVERAFVRLENDRMLERLLNPPEGFYPRIGHVTPGSSLSLGAGYRRPRLFGERAVFSASALGSVKKYWLLETQLLMPQLANNALQLEMYAQRSSWPQEAFFGIGPGALRRAQSNFSLENTIAGASGTVRMGRLPSLGDRIEYLRPRAGAGQASGIPSIDDLFPIDQIPGFGAGTDFARFEVFADLNSREPQGNPRRGGRYFVSYAAFQDFDLDRYDFRRVEVDLQQYVPLLRGRRVLAFHGLLSASDAGDGQQVPFYLMRSLGGPDDLRGFRRNRFRDRNLLLLQAEYRWEAFTAVDAALFVDAGQVAPRVGDLALARFEKDYGFGLRFGSIRGVFLRIEGAFGSRDGKHLVVRFGNVF